jgi:hypothetical protein
MGSPTDTSVAAIAFWIRSKVATINNLLFESFVIDGNLEIVDANGVEITSEAAAVLQHLYKIYDYDVRIRSNMNSLNNDQLVEATEQGVTLRRVNRNEVSKTYASLKKDELKELNALINAYRSRSSGPTQIAGDDTVVGVYPDDSYSRDIYR